MFRKQAIDYHGKKLLGEVSLTQPFDVDITSMPMAYNLLVGDMGSQFSGGQILRLLLARAFYKEPKILFLDEATSHLDVQNELNIGKNIKSLTMTRIIVAHRPETINQVDRIVILNHGVLSSLNANQIPIHS
ncbi:hypothetical protein VA249_30120 [Vibrio alfacsensis]|uniref:ATP-binding cassette domain-containing protein n=1 Tax=Vibrio alfacsensis TaxID=1074311 RepID=UPI001BEDFE89|nr:ATP-binding cassette domain-containing protein [Vibrio alfacsensis]BBM66366.1 hypothetical protein VA249_30120 [Vibrio alfacsensis]